MSIRVKERKIVIGKDELTFRLDFKALVKFEEKFDNAIGIFNDLLRGNRIYSNSIKILSCSCKEREVSEDELMENLPFSFGGMKLIDDVVEDLISELFQEKKDDGATGGNEGNE